ncbi:Multiprotein-bridging factor 1b [Linum perenne]
MSFSQDWEPVVIRKKAPTAAAKKDEKVVNAARRAGAEIESIKKSNAGSNKAASSSTSLNTRKLDEETEIVAREYPPFPVHCFLLKLTSWLMVIYIDYIVVHCSFVVLLDLL